MDVERIEVTLYTQTQIVTGLIQQPLDERLSDFLNGGTLMRPKNLNTFLELNKVSISHPDGKKERLPNAYINKATIHLLATPDSNVARGLGAKQGPKLYPFIPKSPVRVRLNTPSYAMTGSIHCANGQGVWRVFEGKITFLPLTDVKIRPLANDTWIKANFAIVNREMISSFQKEFTVGS